MAEVNEAQRQLHQTPKYRSLFVSFSRILKAKQILYKANTNFREYTQKIHGTSLRLKTYPVNYMIRRLLHYILQLAQITFVPQ